MVSWLVIVIVLGAVLFLGGIVAAIAVFRKW